MDHKKVLIVGGGIIGSALWSMLNMYYDVVIYEANPEHYGIDLNWYEHVEDFFERPEKYVSQFDYVVNATAVYDQKTIVRVVEACMGAGTHYLSFTEDVFVTAALQDIDQSDILIAPNCGLAPGIVQIIANGLAESFDEVANINMYVGALPLSASNLFRYHVTWSAAGVVNEYANPAKVILDGKEQTVYSLYDAVGLTINGIEYEAFPTSGGLGTLTETWAGRANSVLYQTIRYPGHLREIKRYLNGKLHLEGESRGRLLADLEKTRSIFAIDDTVLLHVVVDGKIDGEDRCAVFSKQVFKSEGLGSLTAIQRTTAGGAAIVLDVHAKEMIKQVGFLRQEEVPMHVAFQNSYIHSAGWR